MKLNFGQYSIQTKTEKDKKQVYDIVRKRWIILNPEEEVRQLWLHYLVDDWKISPTKIAVERGFRINERIKRFDICVYDSSLIPEILIECKSPTTPLRLASVEQLFRYNIELKCTKFILTNGIEHRAWKLNMSHIIEVENMNQLLP